MNKYFISCVMLILLGISGCSAKVYDCSDKSVLKKLKLIFIGDSANEFRSMLESVKFSNIITTAVDRDTNTYACQLNATFNGLDKGTTHNVVIQYGVRPVESSEANFIIFDSNANLIRAQFARGVSEILQARRTIELRKNLTEAFRNNPIKQLSEDEAKRKIVDIIRREDPRFDPSSIVVSAADPDGDGIKEYFAVFNTSYTDYRGEVIKTGNGFWFIQFASTPGASAELYLRGKTSWYSGDYVGHTMEYGSTIQYVPPSVKINIRLSDGVNAELSSDSTSSYELQTFISQKFS